MDDLMIGIDAIVSEWGLAAIRAHSLTGVTVKDVLDAARALLSTRLLAGACHSCGLVHIDVVGPDMRFDVSCFGAGERLILYPQATRPSSGISSLTLDTYLSGASRLKTCLSTDYSVLKLTSHSQRFDLRCQICEAARPPSLQAIHWCLTSTSAPLRSSYLTIDAA